MKYRKLNPSNFLKTYVCVSYKPVNIDDRTSVTNDVTGVELFHTVTEHVTAPIQRSYARRD